MLGRLLSGFSAGSAGRAGLCHLSAGPSASAQPAASPAIAPAAWPAGLGLLMAPPPAPLILPSRRLRSDRRSGRDRRSGTDRRRSPRRAEAE